MLVRPCFSWSCGSQGPLLRGNQLNFLSSGQTWRGVEIDPRNLAVARQTGRENVPTILLLLISAEFISTRQEHTQAIFVNKVTIHPLWRFPYIAGGTVGSKVTTASQQCPDIFKKVSGPTPVCTNRTTMTKLWPQDFPLEAEGRRGGVGGGAGEENRWGSER